ncbi:MAG: hypothetical protein AAGH65_11610, partial [Pseudomonadota bacterium]
MLRQNLAIVALVCCLATALAVPAAAIELQRLQSSIAEHSLAPRLTMAADGSPILSWLEKTETGHRFLLAKWDGERFGQPHRVAEGDRFFANWADTPGVRVSDDGTWLAHWLVRSG